MRSLLSIKDLGTEELLLLVDRACEYGRDEKPEPLLAGRTVGIFFRVRSTRTRTAFTAAAQRLGAHVITFAPDDLQVSTGETLEDTGRVLAEYLDLLVIRTNESLEEMQRLAAAGMGVVNALTADEHPTQAIADLGTLKEAHGSLEGLHLLYVGEGNSSAAALTMAAAKIPGMRVTLACPPGYGLPADVLAEASSAAARCGAGVAQVHDFGELPEGVDAVYTSRWKTMGVTKEEPDWEAKFRPYRVSRELMESVGGERAIFLHDLPAVRGADVDDDVLDGGRSWAWRQAHFKMTSAMAILGWCAEA